MAQEHTQVLSEFEQFSAEQVSFGLDEAGLLLRVLWCRLPRDEFVRLAGPLFSGLKLVLTEADRMNLALRMGLWAPGTHPDLPEFL